MKRNLCVCLYGEEPLCVPLWRETSVRASMKRNLCVCLYEEEPLCVLLWRETSVCVSVNLNLCACLYEGEPLCVPLWRGTSVRAPVKRNFCACLYREGFKCTKGIWPALTHLSMQQKSCTFWRYFFHRGTHMVCDCVYVMTYYCWVSAEKTHHHFSIALAIISEQLTTL